MAREDEMKVEADEKKVGEGERGLEVPQPHVTDWG